MQYSHGQIRKLFDRIAPRYDLLNSLLSLGIDSRWRASMIDSCRSLERPRILDIATGTADVIIEARSLLPRCLVGLDLSREMLRRAQHKTGTKPCDFVEGVAESLPFRDGAFDLVMVAFGVRNFSSRALGLAEMRRVLTPGGHVRILDFSRPEGIFRSLYLPYFRRFLPSIGGMISGSRSAYAYLPDTVMEFPSQKSFESELRHAGFTDISWTPLTLGITTLYEARADHQAA